MNLNQIVKIKELINKSTILNAQERVEWLGLLDLMNDKQLLELEKILNVAQNYQKTLSQGPMPPVPRPPKPAMQSSFDKLASPLPNPPHPTFASNFAKASSDKKATADRQGEGIRAGGGIKGVTAGQASSFAKPSFSHILNLPKFDGSKIQGKPQPPPLRAAENKFGSTLKQMLAEKELNPPRKNETAPLPNKPEERPPVKLPEKPPFASDFAKASSDLQEATGGLRPVEPALQHIVDIHNPTVVNIDSPDVIVQQRNPAAAAPPGPETSAASVAAPGLRMFSLEQAFEPAAARPASPLTSLGGPITSSKIAEQPAKIGPPPASPSDPLRLESRRGLGGPAVAAPRKNFPPVLEKSPIYSMGNLAKIGQKPSAPRADAGINFVKPTEDLRSTIKPQTGPFKKIIPAKMGPAPALNALRDAQALTVEVLHSDLSAAAAGLKKLGKNYGFHEMLFSLEQSPLYKLYINTGSKILNGGTTFAELEVKRPAGYLNKQEFEQFTDLLREVQAGEK